MADPVFCSLLDARRGGCLSLRPAAPHETVRAYLGDTAMLRTVFRTRDGSAAVTDFMPVGRKPGSSTHDYASLDAPGALVRRIEGLHGRVEFALAYRPSIAFGAAAPRLRAADRCVTSKAGLRSISTGTGSRLRATARAGGSRSQRANAVTWCSPTRARPEMRTLLPRPGGGRR